MPMSRPAFAAMMIASMLAACTTTSDTTPTAQMTNGGTVSPVPTLAIAPPITPPEPAGLQPAPPAAAEALAEGKRQFRNGNFGLAERAFRTTVEAHNTNGEGWLGLAATYDQLQRFDLADRAYDRAAQILGARPELLNNRGYSHLMRGDRRKAAEYFARAQAIDPANEVVVANLALLSGQPRR